MCWKGHIFIKIYSKSEYYNTTTIINHQSVPNTPSKRSQLSTMRSSAALVSFLSSLSTSVAMAIQEPYDYVLHEVTASILEESLEVKNGNKKNQENTPSPFSKIKTSTMYKKLLSHIEPLKIQNGNDGPLNKAKSVTIVDIDDNIDDIAQKMESIQHLVEEHQQHQGGKALEECNISPTTTTTTTATSDDDDSLLKRKVSSDKESITKMDYGYLNRGTCSSSTDVCVPQNKAIEGNDTFLKLEDASYASIGYCVPLPILEDMEYTNVVANTIYLIDKEELNEEDEITDSYYHNHPQYDQHHRQLDSLDCTAVCPDPRPDVSDYSGSFLELIYFYQYDYGNISCWNTTGITDMSYGFFGNYEFNDPLECWDTSQVTSMEGMFRYASDFDQPIGEWNMSSVTTTYYMFGGTTNYMFGGSSFNQPIDTWDVSQVEDMDQMFSYASNFNQCLSTWAGKTSNDVYTSNMLYYTDCPIGFLSTPYPEEGPWCQGADQQCISIVPSNCNDEEHLDHYQQQQYQQHQLQQLDGRHLAEADCDYCQNEVNGRPEIQKSGAVFRDLIKDCIEGNCQVAYTGPINCWDTGGVTDMKEAFRELNYFNDPLECWDTSQGEVPLELTF
jgi:hypothetical protein